MQSVDQRAGLWLGLLILGISVIPGGYVGNRPPSARIVGLIVEGDDQPVPFAAVTARQEDVAAIAWTTESDAKGRFLLDLVPAGDWLIEVAARGYAGSLRRVAAPLGSPHTMRVRLERVAAIGGRVYGPSGSPLADASVSVVGSRVWPTQSVTTDHEGRFRWDGIPAGVYEVRARKGNLISPTVGGLSLEPGVTRILSFRLLEGHEIRGRVITRQSRQPIDGATVFVGEHEVGLLSRNMKTGADGRFRFEGVTDADVRISARADGYVASLPSLKAPGGAELTLVLEPAATVRGRVVDVLGEPVSGALVQPLSKGAVRPRLSEGDSLGVTSGDIPPITAAASGVSAISWGFSEMNTTDSRGRFEITGLSSGRFQFLATHPDYSTGQSAAVRVKTGATHEDVAITLEPGGEVRGRVVDARGVGVASVAVELNGVDEPFPRSVLSQDDGSFSFRGVRGTVEVTARSVSDVTRRETIEVAPGRATRLTLTLSEALGEVRGRAVDERGFPIEARVTVSSLQPETPIRRTAVSNSDGSFFFGNLPEPPYRLRASHAQYSDTIVERIDRTDGELEVVMTRGVSVRGRVTDDWTQEGIAGATLAMKSTLEFASHTDDDGGFSFRNLPPGRYTLAIDHPDYELHEEEIEVAAPAYGVTAVALDLIRLPPTGQIAGEVVDAHNDPVVDAEVAWGTPPAWSRSAKTDERGEFVLKGVAPGMHLVSARHETAGEATTRAPVVVRAQDVTPGVYLRLPGRVE